MEKLEFTVSVKPLLGHGNPQTPSPPHVVPLPATLGTIGPQVLDHEWMEACFKLKQRKPKRLFLHFEMNKDLCEYLFSRQACFDCNKMNQLIRRIINFTYYAYSMLLSPIQRCAINTLLILSETHY